MKTHKFLYKQSYDPDVTKDGCFDDAKQKKTNKANKRPSSHGYNNK